MAQVPSRTDHRKEASEQSDISVIKDGHLNALNINAFTPIELQSMNALGDTQNDSILNDLANKSEQIVGKSIAEQESDVHHE